jgi:hypothetical protein
LKPEAFKTVQIEIGLSENGGNPLQTKNRSIFFSGQKLIMPIVEIVFPQSVYLFHCTIPNNAGGGETTFAIAVIHNKNSSKS